jgi:hypothetical protein
VDGGGVIPANLSPRNLRDLGHVLLERARAAEAADRRSRRELTPEGVERLAEIIASGSRPTVGFWCRYKQAETDGPARKVAA